MYNLGELMLLSGLVVVGGFIGATAIGMTTFLVLRAYHALKGGK